MEVSGWQHEQGAQYRCCSVRLLHSPSFPFNSNEMIFLSMSFASTYCALLHPLLILTSIHVHQDPYILYILGLFFLLIYRLKELL